NNNDNNEKEFIDIIQSLPSRRYPYLSTYLNNSRDLLVKKICKWSQTSPGSSSHNSPTRNTIDLLPAEQMSCVVKEILEMILQWMIEELNVPADYIYRATYLADKYVKQVGSVKQSQLLWVMLISCLITIKVQSDHKSVRMHQVAKRFHTSGEMLLRMELQFLNIIGYSVNVEEQTINAFLTGLFLEFQCSVTDRTQSIIQSICRQQQQQQQILLQQQQLQQQHNVN
ncbi:hypothetical protein SAMD00019534_005940, partial [Acytostelium subglobosum LB1]|uniref:hypothetical protein n=1 Tax=Acytostelium subglobosum LB1 TaxID=1410327 RepID=UPI000644C16F